MEHDTRRSSVSLRVVLSHAEFLASMLAAIGLGGTAIYHAGVLRGRFDHHEVTVIKRLDTIENVQFGRVTREELDARFGAISEQLAYIAHALEKLTDKRGAREVA